MMTDGDVTAPERDGAPALAGHLAGHVAIGELLRAQGEIPTRTLVGRLFGLSPLSAETQVLYRGVVGEINVGESLDRLGTGWVVLHALTLDEDASDIDHLVIGPCGVFIVSTKNHSGLEVWASQRTFVAGGIRQPHIRDMELEMGQAERLLSESTGHPVQVAGILAIVAPKSLVVTEKHRDVTIVPASQLVPWLMKRKGALSYAGVARIGAAAARASTWHQAERHASEPLHVRDCFEALRREVRRAWRTQVAWIVGTSVLAIGTFGVITYSILSSAIESFWQ
jgi:hypothetical protein